MKNKRLIVGIIGIALGILCQILYFIGTRDTFWSAMGGGLIGAGAIHLYLGIKYNKNANYRENYDTETKDERNRYISMKAWSWSGYLFIFISAAAVVGFKLTGYDSLSQFSSYALCLLLAIYCISYFVLRRKY